MAREHLTIILRGRHSTWSTSVSFCGQVQHAEHLQTVLGSPATIEQYCGRRLRLPGKRSTWSTSVSLCVAGAALGAPQSFAWQVRAEHLSFMCVVGAAPGAPPAAREVRGSPAIEYCGCRLRLRGRRSAWSTSVSFCVAGEIRGSPATIEYCGRRLRLCGRRGTWSTSVSVCVPGAALGAPGRRSIWSTSVSFCKAGATLGAPESHFAWQVQHWKHLSCVLRLRGTCVLFS